MVWVMDLAAIIGQFILGVLAGLGVSVFLPAWIRKYAESLVDKKFAQAVEREKAKGRQPVDQENATHSASLDVANQLRMAAIERRLAAHQEAFSLWRKLYKSMHTDEVNSVVMQCQEWWEHNCLYLEPSVSDDFSRAYSSASDHATMLSSLRVGGDACLVQENWQRIIKPGTSIFQAMRLPPIINNLETTKDARGDISK